MGLLPAPPLGPADLVAEHALDRLDRPDDTTPYTVQGALDAFESQQDTSVDDVAPSKRLADELEVLHAVRAITTGTAQDLIGILQHVVDVAVESLSCEVGLLRDGAGRTAATSSWSGVDIHDPRLGAPLDILEERAAGGSLCVQDTDSEPLLAPLGRAQGVRSLLAVSIPAPVGGILVVAHTSAAPRGFTTCASSWAGRLPTPRDWWLTPRRCERSCGQLRRGRHAPPDATRSLASATA